MGWITSDEFKSAPLGKLSACFIRDIGPAVSIPCFENWKLQLYVKSANQAIGVRTSDGETWSTWKEDWGGDLSNQTWDSLILLCATLPQREPRTYFVNGTISGKLSSYGTLVTLVNRGGWKSVLFSTGYVNGQVSNGAVTNKTGAFFKEDAIEF